MNNALLEKLKQELVALKTKYAENQMELANVGSANAGAEREHQAQQAERLAGEEHHEDRARPAAADRHR